MEIKAQHIVAVTYNLYISEKENGKEKLREAAPESKPLVYCHGEGLMLPKFEEQLQGKHVDDTFDFVLLAKDAYGEYINEHVLELDKKLFYNAEGNFDTERVYEGNIVQMRTVDNDIVNAQIKHIGLDTVTIDLNHPLAGKDLHFVGKVLDIRPASEDELEKIRHPKKCGKCHNCGSDKEECANKSENCQHCNG